MDVVRYDEEYEYERAGALDRSERDVMTEIGETFWTWQGRGEKYVDFGFLRAWLRDIREGMESYVHDDVSDWEDMLKEEGMW